MERLIEQELEDANWGDLIEWHALDAVERGWLNRAWVYYRPLGFGLVNVGAHDCIASVLLWHHRRNDFEHYHYQGGPSGEALMEEAAYAFHSGRALMGMDIPPFYLRDGDLSQEEILALSQEEALQDFHVWYEQRYARKERGHE